jgi:NAD-dependent dihydropyrimidine dehydrogenase PreA subunit
VTYIVAEPCLDVKDASCVEVCPVDCIYEAERLLVIDPDECIDCGACTPECPVEAIFPEQSLPRRWDAFVDINYAHAKGTAAVDALVAAYARDSSGEPPPPE